MGTRVQVLDAARVMADRHPTVELRATVRDQALTYLACEGGWVSRDRLGFLFWPDAREELARHNVRQLLKRIRRLGWTGDIEVDDAVRWPVLTDLGELRAAVAAQRWEAIPTGAHLLPGLERNATVEFEHWLLSERARVHDQWRSALLKAAAAAADAGDPELGARRLEPLLADDDGDLVLPVYMELAARAGDRAAAVAAFDRVASRLREELGVDPPQRSCELARRLRSATSGRVIAAREALPPGLLVGRQQEVAEILGLLAQQRCRMLTLLGPGGIGKSTLARMLLARAAARYADGAVLVSLESFTEPDEIPAHIAAALDTGLDPRLDPVGQLAEAVGDRQLLQVLDNAEHLPAGWVTFARLLRACPRLTMLVTSRERLQLGEEWVYEVPGLPDRDGAELFQQRGRRVAPQATVTRADAVAVCRAVGGSPLGIELAAPWLRVMPGAEIADRIASDPGLLSGGPRDGASRHRSIDAAMAHSWRLTPAGERAAIEALSVFAAPYTGELAARVVGASPAQLRGLVDRSLVHRRADGRYVSHPLVRQYAAARLAERPEHDRDVRDRHALVVLGALDPPAAALEDPELLDDAVAAWRYAVDRPDPPLLRRALEGWVALLTVAGRYRLGLELLRSAAGALGVEPEDGADPALVATLRRSESRLLDHLGRHVEAIDRAARAVDAARRAGQPRLLVLSLLALAWSRKTVDGDSAQYAVTRQALLATESLDDDLLMVQVRNSLGCSAATLEECREHLAEGLALATRADLPNLAAVLAGNLGGVLACLGDVDGARRHLEQAVAAARSMARLPVLVDCLPSLATLCAERGDLVVARELAAEAEELAGSTESVDAKIRATLVAGEVARQAGDQAGADARMRRAARQAAAVENESLMLRSLRLRGQLLVDAGSVDEGLGVLAVVVAGPTRKGDYTSEILNPRVWAQSTAGISPERVQRARAWASGRSVEDLVGEILH